VFFIVAIKAIEAVAELMYKAEVTKRKGYGQVKGSRDNWRSPNGYPVTTLHSLSVVFGK